VAIRAVISDFGGVLTTPLLRSFLAFQDQTGISAEALGSAMQRIAERRGEHPLFELERGRIAEVDFLESLRGELVAELAGSAIERETILHAATCGEKLAAPP
jgi:putative hydrolase of the HAD superfamily